MSFSLYVALGVFAAAAGLLLCSGFVEGETKWPDNCSSIDPNRDEPNFDSIQRNSPSIDRSFHNRTAIGISWSVKEEDLLDLCGFTIHWYQERTQSEVKHFIVREPEVTSHLVTGLQPGTKYRFYVITYYATKRKTRSWTLITNTDGCGDDVSFCNQKGTERCDKVTGNCICKTYMTFGEVCDECLDGFYLHSLGCVGCDNCVNDGVSSNGTCRLADDPDDTMMCNCFFPYTGKHCRDCEKGYYWKNNAECAPCDCFHDRDDKSHEPSCDQITGKCNCGVSRTGDKCEKCAEGYAVGEGCTRHSRNAGVMALIIIIVIIIILVVFVTFYLICHRYCKDRLAHGFWRVHLREEFDKVNFTALEEEPEYEAHKTKA